MRKLMFQGKQYDIEHEYKDATGSTYYLVIDAELHRPHFIKPDERVQPKLPASEQKRSDLFNLCMSIMDGNVTVTPAEESKRWQINVYDNDYLAYIDSYEFFGTKAEAEAHCKENSWTGEAYVVAK